MSCKRSPSKFDKRVLSEWMGRIAASVDHANLTDPCLWLNFHTDLFNLGGARFKRFEKGVLAYSVLHQSGYRRACLQVYKAVPIPKRCSKCTRASCRPR